MSETTSRTVRTEEGRKVLWLVPSGTKFSECEWGCGKMIGFVLTRAGKHLPVSQPTCVREPDGTLWGEAHFADCTSERNRRRAARRARATR